MRFDRDETKREAIPCFKTGRTDHRQRLLSASEAPWDPQGTRKSSEHEPKRSSPLACSPASKIVPTPRREHDFLLGHLVFFDQICLGALGGSLGFLLGALGGPLGLTSAALGCSSVSLGALLASFWLLLKPSSPPIMCSGVLQNDLQTTFASQTSISRKCNYYV